MTKQGMLFADTCATDAAHELLAYYRGKCGGRPGRENGELVAAWAEMLTQTQLPAALVRSAIDAKAEALQYARQRGRRVPAGSPAKFLKHIGRWVARSEAYRARVRERRIERAARARERLDERLAQLRGSRRTDRARRRPDLGHTEQRATHGSNLNDAQQAAACDAVEQPFKGYMRRAASALRGRARQDLIHTWAMSFARVVWPAPPLESPPAVADLDDIEGSL